MINMNDLKNSLIQLIGTEYFHKEAVAIQYGNINDGNDIDILIIQKGETTTPFFVAGLLDILVLSIENCYRLIEVLDPLVVEPLLTGKYLLGDKGTWLSLLNLLASIKSSQLCVQHAIQRSFDSSITSLNYWHDYVKNKKEEFLYWSFNNFSFSISYMSTAHYYSQPGLSAIDLNSLITSENILFPEFWSYRDRMKKENRRVDINIYNIWQNKWMEYISSFERPREL